MYDLYSIFLSHALNMENTETLIDFERICRLCMVEDPSMLSIFCNNDDNNVPLPLRIMACVSIEIAATDGLPSHICKTCLCQVDGWYKFKDLCENTDNTLRKLVNLEPVDYDSLSKIQQAVQGGKEYFSKSSEDAEKIESNESGPNVDNGKPVTINEIIQNRAWKSEGDIGSSRGGLKVPEDFNGSECNNDTDGYSSDDCLTLRSLKEKNESDALKVKKTCKTEEEEEDIYKRTIQMQTDETDDEGYFVSESIVLGRSIDGTKRGRNKKIQTSDGNTSTSKKKFRMRPAVPSACTLCDKVYKNSEILRQHMKSHHVSGNIECQHCKMKFVSLRSLKYHEQRKHSNLEPVPCSYCGKKFLDKKYLRVHENIHSQNNQYVCQFCGRKFIMKTNLTVHISRHHTQKSNDFVCQICGKAFPFKLYLKKHFKTHTDYKPHKCSYCEAKFRESTLLRKHVNSIHLKLRPFVCQYCQKTFTRRMYLREHMESQHLGIPRKVSCRRCGESFHSRSKLKQHDCEMAEVDDKPHVTIFKYELGN